MFGLVFMCSWACAQERMKFCYQAPPSCLRWCAAGLCLAVFGLIFMCSWAYALEHTNNRYQAPECTPLNPHLAHSLHMLTQKYIAQV